MQQSIFLELPFKLSYRYLMFEDTMKMELLSSDVEVSKLITLGLTPTEISISEFECASEVNFENPQLSKHDSAALAIAKERGIKLLTGDAHLRNAAEAMGVEVVGSIWILDQLLEPPMSRHSLPPALGTFDR